MNTSDSHGHDDGLPTSSAPADWTREQWKDRLTNVFISLGDALVRFPLGLDLIEFSSYLVFLGQGWRSRSEAVKVFRAAADFLEQGNSHGHDDGLATSSAPAAWTREHWKARLTNAFTSLGDALLRFPLGLETVDFSSYLIFLGQGWRSRSEAVETFRAAADFLDTTITDPAEWHADAQWALQQWEDGEFENIEHDYVAVYQKKFLDTGNDPNELRQNWSKEFGIPFQRIIVKYVGKEE